MRHIRKIYPVNIEIKPSKFLKDGIGLFATRNLPSGTTIGDSRTLGREVFHKWAELKSVDSVTRRKIFDYCLGTKEGFYMPLDLNAMTLPWHMNHSCDGNVAFNDSGNFVLIRKVKRGDELCWDYGLAETNPGLHMKCRCGSRKCRNVITGNDWKNPVFRKKNEGYMLPDLRVN